MNFRRIVATIAIPLLVLGISNGCKKKESIENIEEQVVIDTPVAGEISVGVEESIFPIVDDVVNVFQYEYNRVHINLETKSEKEILRLLALDSLRVAVLPRALTEEEKQVFVGRVTPKQTEFASDAIVFVTNKAYKDSVIDYNKIIKNLKSVKSDRGGNDFLVFDKYTSSVASQLREAVGSNSFPADYAYFLNTTNEVVQYVNDNPNAIGVIGLNWLSQSDASIESLKSNLKVLAVLNSSDNKYYKPSQNNIAEGTYPLIRKLYVIDLQGKSGLGAGLASYIAGPKGQRIVLKSGLVPTKVPPREIIVRKKL